MGGLGLGRERRGGKASYRPQINLERSHHEGIFSEKSTGMPLTGRWASTEDSRLVQTLTNSQLPFFSIPFHDLGTQDESP